MSILINEAYANASTPFWEANGGGSDGVRLLSDTIGSGAKAVADGAQVKFFDINLPATFIGKSVRITFSGNVGTITMASGTAYKVLVGLLGNFTKPSGATGQLYALNTITSPGTNQAGNFSVSMVISPSDTTIGVYVFNRSSGIAISNMTLTTSACAIELIDDSPTYTQAIVTATP